MKHILGVMMVVFVAYFSASVEAATDKALIEQASQIADELSIPFNAKKPVLPQVLEMREELRDRVFDISRMTSLHSARCKRVRRDLMEVNSLVRKLRSSDE